MFAELFLAIILGIICTVMLASSVLLLRVLMRLEKLLGVPDDEGVWE